MKQISTLALTLVTLLTFNSGFTEPVYTINTNTSWKSTYNTSYMSGATFIIASGVTLTLDQPGATCVNCTFSGGSIAVTQNFTIQAGTFSGNKLSVSNSNLSLQAGKTTFTNVTGTISGTSVILGSAPLQFTSSVFTFSGTSSFVPQLQLDLYSSTFNFYGNSFFSSTGGPDNLYAGSHLVAGDGSTTSKAYLNFNGATLNLEDAASSFALANSNNYYFNWSNYNAVSAGKSYSANSSINCGTSGKNACQMPYMYGPSTSNSTGNTAGFSSLPVVLTDFTVVLSAKNTVELSWTTQQEINSASFVIERSADGAVWNAIGYVTAKGNSSVLSNYAFTDAAPATGINYYRLRMVDLDAAYIYSDVKAVRSTAVVNAISFYPNPATNYVNISLAGTTTTGMRIQLVNLSGQVMLEQKLAAGTSGMISLSVQQYTRGMYILSISSADGIQQSAKIVINH